MDERLLVDIHQTDERNPSTVNVYFRWQIGNYRPKGKP